MKSILITGAKGFIGSNLSKFFFNHNYQVFGVGKKKLDEKNLSFFKNYYIGDILDDEVKSFLKTEKPDYIFHCAGSSSIQNSIKDPSNDFNNNTILTFKFLDFIRQFTPQSKFYFFSSAAVYGNPYSLPINEKQIINPISPYGFHKFMSENICKEFSKIYSLNVVVLRIFSAYGPNLKRQIFYDLMNKFSNEEKIKLRGNGKESRDFIHILDLCRAIELIMKKNYQQFEVFNIGSGEEVSIEKLAKIFSNFLKTSKIIEFDLNNNEGMPLNWRSDITKLENIGFRPIMQLPQGIEDYIGWYKKNCN